ncbi:ABC transporter ATP-binding protein [Ensifer adhaerens]|uniref:ABC transporter ATP-binding protein n=1 Tax=Ensifer adhaerens TaxID=106592 RepID=UPI001CC0DE3E|nr:ABC transporter ATP-binding protein [Ensifer adhaerens]MBZ7926044.1 ABC transporter ATP-binding protein [Ensifer adhaerens]UAX94809.1 ABC transporter ATP-binding protein [Ensifer adhaerens]UAY03301.1 ABC transporter ATP-binding protein [Ensifer adhaerens]UAY11286.1 ABC transporter ATP-binding protein [Ensifer adhaerens]
MSKVIFSNITKRFPGVAGATAVDRLNLTIEEGTLVTLLGPSGCGKTTTLRMLAGFETPSDGTITIGGRDVTNVPVNARNVGMVFQSYALFPHMSVRENVEYGVRLLNLPRNEMRDRVDSTLETMALAQYADRSPSRLSGGQQQRVALARAVVTQPKVLLFDEPLSNLDAQLRERMRDELRSIQLRLGITSLYVTHDQSEAMAISDRVVVMRNGIIEQDDTPLNVYARPGTGFVAEFMGKANILTGKVETIEQSGIRVRITPTVALTLPYGDHAYRQGDEVRCVVRPEHIRVDPEGTVEAKVRRVVFQGAHVEYLTDLDGQDCVFLDNDYHRTGVAEAGQTLRLSIDSRPVWILPQNKADAMERAA